MTQMACLNSMRDSMIDRRIFGASVGAVALVALSGCSSEKGFTDMYGLIGKVIAHEKKRDELISILLDGTNGMPGCLSYVISKDVTDDNALWVTEVWDSKENHQASLSLEAVKLAISKGKPLIAGFGERFETMPVGGHGLS